MPIVETHDLTRVYGEGDAAVTALEGVSVSLEQGEYVAVMGPSGCGKSTLLNLIGGLDKPTSGTVEIDDQEITTLDDDTLTELRRKRMGFIFQFFNLLPVLDATENAALPLMLDGVSSAEAKHRAAEWLDRVGLGDRLDARPDQLSGGQQQRVAVARALVGEPALVLADEPTGNLDTRSSDEIADLLAQVSGEWLRTVLMVTHDLKIAGHAHRVLLMKDGRIVDDLRLDGQGAEAVRVAMERSGLL